MTTENKAALKIREAMQGLVNAYDGASTDDKQVIRACMEELKQIHKEVKASGTPFWMSQPASEYMDVIDEDELDMEESMGEGVEMDDDLEMLGEDSYDDDLFSDDFEEDDDLDLGLSEEAQVDMIDPGFDLEDDEDDDLMDFMSFASTTDADELDSDEALALEALELAAAALKAAAEESAEEVAAAFGDDPVKMYIFSSKEKAQDFAKKVMSNGQIRLKGKPSVKKTKGWKTYSVILKFFSLADTIPMKGLYEPEHKRYLDIAKDAGPSMGVKASTSSEEEEADEEISAAKDEGLEYMGMDYMDMLEMMGGDEDEDEESDKPECDDSEDDDSEEPEMDEEDSEDEDDSEDDSDEDSEDEEDSDEEDEDESEDMSDLEVLTQEELKALEREGLLEGSYGADDDDDSEEETSVSAKLDSVIARISQLRGENGPLA